MIITKLQNKKKIKKKKDNTRTVTANYKNHEPAVIPVTSLNSSTIDENTSSHYIDQSYFVLKEK